NPNGNGNLVAARAEGNVTGHNARAEGNAAGQNGDQIRCYNCRGEIWLRVQQMMKGFDIGIQKKKAKLFNDWESNLKFLNNLQPEWSQHVNIIHQTKDLHTADYTQLYDFLKYNQKENYMQQPMPNPKDITDPITAMNMTLALMAKAFKPNYSTPTNNNQRISSNPRNMKITQPGMNMGQDRQMQMVGGNANYNLNGNGNLVVARAEGNTARLNGNQIRYYNCRGVGHYARNCTVRPRRRDAAYLQTKLLIAQKEEAGIQLQAEDKYRPRVLRLTKLPSMIQTDQLRKLGAKGDIGFFIGYSADSCAYKIYNRRTKKIIETMNVSSDELSMMAFEQRSSKPGLQRMTSRQISLGLDHTYALSIITSLQPTKGEFDLLFEAMYNDYVGGQPSATARTILAAQEPQARQTLTISTSIADTTPTPTNLSSLATNCPNTSQDVDELNSQQQHV
nr:hypothetical protein [Tanacetum cinerariifolium]